MDRQIAIKLFQCKLIGSSNETPTPTPRSFCSDLLKDSPDWIARANRIGHARSFINRTDNANYDYYCVNNDKINFIRGNNVKRMKYV